MPTGTLSSVQCLGPARPNKLKQARLPTCMNQKYREKAGLSARASSAMKLVLTSVGEGPEDGAGVLVHELTKVHGDGEQEDQEKKVDAKE